MSDNERKANECVIEESLMLDAILSKKKKDSGAVTGKCIDSPPGRTNVSFMIRSPILFQGEEVISIAITVMLKRSFPFHTASLEQLDSRYLTYI